MRRLSVLILACLLVAACGDDTGGEGAGSDDGGAETDEFCLTLESLAEIDALSDPTPEEVILLEEAKAAAPDDLGPAIDELIAATEVFIASDLEAMAEFDEEAQLQASADLVAAATECGLDVPIFVYGGGQAESGDPGDTAAARERYDASDLRTALETANPELEDSIDAIGRGNDDITVQVAGLDDPATGFAVCETVDEYLEEIGYPEASVTVTDPGNTAYATRPPSGACTPAG